MKSVPFVFVIGPESPVSPEMLQLPPEFVKSNFRVTLPLHDDDYGGGDCDFDYLKSNSTSSSS